ncbi:DUF397 domain-containing protein [Streptomyces beihaiensis]|uniref:DUF397 domain-containing protein n=1 Tax=Streptomyces beihaiensis TaxID=2984495 RepID=A0ABT3U609_9ACTN|nr:DUF397 domain-containing protein [Streptomyces beihaiensis]MCX3063640.1 DUF397 domain-containing protein [Streptomyces beihaiensis]
MNTKHRLLNLASDDAHWFKSSYSNGAGGECLECSVRSGEAVHVRDSKRKDGDVISFASQAWSNFLGNIR